MVLSGGSALSARKIHQKIRDEFQMAISYQAVHKSLKSLVDSKTLKNFHNEYYLNQEWVDSICGLVDSLKNKETITQKKDVVCQKPKPDYMKKLGIAAFRFVPFCLRSFSICESLPEKFKVIIREKEKITFKWNDNLYVWYKTGICVQIITEKEKSIDITSFLMERRTVHNNILNLKSRSVKDVLQLTEKLNPGGKSKLGYVMSIHGVIYFDDPYFDNMLRLLAEPGFLGIHDNPREMIAEKQINSARKRLLGLDKEIIEFPNIYEVIVSGKKKVFSSWSNVVFCCEEHDWKNFSHQLVELESELQHLWFYFYTLKNDLKREIRSNNKKSLKRLSLKQKECAALWHEFENIGATEDTHSLLIKEGLIKTSKIEKVYLELQNLFSHCR